MRCIAFSSLRCPRDVHVATILCAVIFVPLSRAGRRPDRRDRRRTRFGGLARSPCNGGGPPRRISLPRHHRPSSDPGFARSAVMVPGGAFLPPSVNLFGTAGGDGASERRVSWLITPSDYVHADRFIRDSIARLRCHVSIPPDAYNDHHGVRRDVSKGLRMMLLLCTGPVGLVVLAPPIVALS